MVWQRGCWETACAADVAQRTARDGVYNVDWGRDTGWGESVIFSYGVPHRNEPSVLLWQGTKHVTFETNVYF